MKENVFFKQVVCKKKNLNGIFKPELCMELVPVGRGR